jgi:hypothetical protein
MPLNRDQYVRLAGSRWLTLSRRGELYLGPDHLLRVLRRFPYEHYRHVDLRDIQAVTCRRTPVGLAVSLLLGGITLLLTINWIKYGHVSLVGSVILGVLVLATAAIWVVWMFQGTTCSCSVRTGVQSLDLPALNNARAVRRVLPRLRRAIEEVQGHWDNDAIVARADEAYEMNRRLSAVNPDTLAPEPTEDYSPIGHSLLLCFTVATAGITAISWIEPASGSIWLAMLTTPVAQIAGLSGALVNRRRAVPAALRPFLTRSALYCAVLFFVGMSLWLGHSADTFHRLANERSVVSNLAAIATIIGVSVGLPGLIEIARYRGRRRAS